MRTVSNKGIAALNVWSFSVLIWAHSHALAIYAACHVVTRAMNQTPYTAGLVTRLGSSFILDQILILIPPLMYSFYFYTLIH